VIVLVIFGGSQLPKLARNLGHAQQEFKKGIQEGKSDSDAKTQANAEAPACLARLKASYLSFETTI